MPDTPWKNLLSLFHYFDRFRDDIAIIQKSGYRRKAFTYGDLARLAKGCAHFLRGNGVNTGDRVLLWGPNSGEWMVAFWGCLLRGAVVVPMDDGANAEFVSRVVRDSAVKLIFASRERLNSELQLDAAIQLVDLDNIAAVAQREETGDAANAEAQALDYDAFSDVPLTRTHTAQILFTSGTTSEPKGVVLTHGNLLANLQPIATGIIQYRKYERWFHPLRFVTLVPLSHVFGQFMALFVPPLLGAAIVFEQSTKSSEIIQSIKRERATALIAVPRMLETLRNGLEREIANRGESEKFTQKFGAAIGKKFLHRAWMFRGIHRRFGWKFWAFISGGAALPEPDEEFFRRLGYAVVQGYGMTETASLISLNHPFRASAGSIGKVLPGREFRLADDGEILARGENVSSAYLQGGKLRTAEPVEWLHTGDIGALDSEGNLRFLGRKKNVIVTPAGLNIYPGDLEAALRKQPAVRDCVVAPMDQEGISVPCAVLLLNSSEITADHQSATSKSDGESPNVARTIVHNANSGLAEYQRMRTWVVWPEADFPRTSTGKPRIAEISARVSQILAGGAGPGQREGSGPSSRLSENLNQIVKRFTRADVRSPRQDLEADLNLTSLDRVELMSALEERFQVELNETAFSNAKNVADIQALLAQPFAPATPYSYPDWAQTRPVRVLRLAIYYLLVWPATALLAHPRILGRENFSSLRGPVLVVCNHVTRRSDIGLILAALPIPYRHNLATAMGGETLQTMRRPPREWFFLKRWTYQAGYWLVTALFNVFPLPQQSGFRQSFRFAGESVDRGYSILVFPEGVVSRDGSVEAFQSGIGLLAQNLRLPVVPLRLDGLWGMKLQHRRLARRGELTVRIGPAMNFPDGAEPDEFAQMLRDLVQSL